MYRIPICVMKNQKNRVVLVILLFISIYAKAQIGNCQQFKSAQSTMGIYPCFENLRSDTFNILKYTINADITDFVKDTIRCNTIVKFTPKMNGQTKIRFDLLKMFVDSVKYAGSK